MANVASSKPHTREKLAQELRNLGVESGDILFIHSSFKSLGPVDGGAGTVVSALEDAVGPEGLILMPAFNLVEWDKRAKTWNIETTPSTVGWLTEFFRVRWAESICAWGVLGQDRQLAPRFRGQR